MNSRSKKMLIRLGASIVAGLVLAVGIMAISNQGSESGTGGYTPGTYTATAAGISSDVAVTITFDASSMTDVQIDVSGETAGLGADIGDDMAASLLELQSADIDGVSGVTITSDAIKAAAADCIAQAGGGGAGSGSYTAGTYTATAQGMGEVTVTMTFSDTAITDVQADVSNETPDIGGAQGENLAQMILDAQSADIDNVSSATITSEAVKEAAAACIAQATGSATGDSGTGAADSSAEEAEAEVEAEPEAEPEPEPEEKEETKDTGSTAAGSYTAGTYTATATGMGEVTVTMTFDDTSITDVQADVSNETPEIGGAQGEKLAQMILDAQSADIDNISSATITSEAVKKAAADCIAQAAGGAETAGDAETENTAAAYTAGTYTATATGMGEVTVTMTFDDTSITDVQADVSNETPEIGGAQGETLAQMILDAQSADIDNVSSATITSEAVKKAAADCIAQATA